MKMKRLKIDKKALVQVWQKYQTAKACGEYDGDFDGFLSAVVERCNNKVEQKANGKVKCKITASIINHWLKSLRSYAEYVGRTVEEIAEYEYGTKVSGKE